MSGLVISSGMQQVLEIALEIRPNTTHAEVVALSRVGLSQPGIIRVIGMCGTYITNPSAVVKWIDVHDMTLDQIERALILRTDFSACGISGISVATINLLNRLAGSDNVETLTEMIALFGEIGEKLGYRHPIYAVLHRIEREYNGDLYLAFYDAQEDEIAFMTRMRRVR